MPIKLKWFKQSPEEGWNPVQFGESALLRNASVYR
jgi:hypothetical protein